MHSCATFNEEVVKRYEEWLVIQHYRPRTKEFYRRVVRTFAEARLRRHDGDYRWFLFRVEPVRDDRGDIFKSYGANTDIEDRKRSEALLSAEKRPWK